MLLFEDDFSFCAQSMFNNYFLSYELKTQYTGSFPACCLDSQLLSQRRSMLHLCTFTLDDDLDHVNMFKAVSTFE